MPLYVRGKQPAELIWDQDGAEPLPAVPQLTNVADWA